MTKKTQDYLELCIDAIKYGFTQPISLQVNKKMGADDKELIITELEHFINTPTEQLH